MMTHRSKQISTLVALVMALFCLYGFASVALAQDMVIEKTVIPTTPVQPGDTLTYTITFTNQQGAPATGIMIADTLPVSLTNLSVISSGVAITPMSGLTYTWQVANMSAGDVGVITVTGTISPALPAGNIVNNVIITASNEITLNQETDSATISVAEVSGLSIKKEAPKYAAINKPFSYTLTIVNNGPYTATNVIVTDTLPTGVISTAANISASQGSCNLLTGGVVRCTFGSLSRPELVVSNHPSRLIQRYSLIDGSLLGQFTAPGRPFGIDVGPDGGFYVSIGNGDYIARYDDATGTNQTIFVSDGNNGGVNIPVGLAFGKDGNLYVSGGLARKVFRYDGTTGMPIGTGTFATISGSVLQDLVLGPDGKLYLIDSSNYRVIRLNPNGGVESSSGGVNNPYGLTFGPDGNLYVAERGDNEISRSNGATTVVAPFASVPNEPWNVLFGGDNYLYISYTAPDTIQRYDGTTLIDTFISANLSDPLFMLLDTSRGAEATIVITVTPQTNGIINNTAIVTSDQADPLLTNNNAVVTTTVSGSADLEINKTASANTLFAGQALTYTLTFTNNGPDYAVGVVVTDRLPSGIHLTSLSSSPDVACTELNALVTCQATSFASNTSFTVSLGTVISTALNGLVNNTAHIASQVLDGDPVNNTANQNVTINAQADLSLSKVDFTDPIAAGEILTYTVMLTNSGPSDATNVILTDTLPISSSSVTGKASNGVVCTGMDTVLSCNLGTVSLAPLASSYFDTSREGWAVVTNTNTTPMHLTTYGNPSGHITIRDDLNSGIAPSFFFVAPVSYLGDQSVAYGGKLKFDLRSDYNKDTPNSGDGEIFLKGGGLTLRYCLHPTCSSTAAWASRDWTSRSIVLAESDPSWHKNEAGFPTPTAAEFQQVLANLTAIQIRGDLGRGIGDFGHLDNVELLPGPVRTTITVTVGSTITPNTYITNSVEVRSTTPDLDTANNTATETTLVVGEVDLSLSKIESADPINAGDTLTYTLTISNAGPSAAQDVVVTDTLPMSVTVTYSGTSLGNGCDAPVGGVISCSLSVVDTVTNTGPAVITLAMLLDTDILSGTILTNTAGLTVTSRQTELDLTNNSLTTPVTTTVSSEANLIIRKLDDPDPVTTNRPLTYTIIISNAGPSDALNVVMTDTIMGAATVLTNATPSQGTPCTLGPPTVCNLGTLTNSSRATVTILLRPTAEGVITNVVTATTTTFDSSTPNTASITTTVYGVVALTLTKSVDDTSPALGQRVTYTMVLSNGGTTNATGVVLSDTLPSGLTFVPNSIAVQPNQTGLTLAAPPQAHLVSGLTITHGERITVTFGVTVGATLNNGDTVINTAAITSVQPSGAIPVTDSVSFTIDNQVDLDISKAVMPPVSTLPGRRITYTLRFTNGGAGLATGVVITDLVPISVTAASLNFTVGGDITATAIGSTRYGFNISDMAAGEVGLITITGILSTPLASGRFTNTATITTTTVDTDANNNLAEVGLTVLPEIVINEVDADTPGIDAAEFIELYDGGVGNTPLDGLVLVVYNGGDNQSYNLAPSGNAIDLDGVSTNADGYFVIGNAAVPNVGMTFNNGQLENGADAVALYTGDGTDFPNDTAITTNNLLDALVYDTNDADNATLLTLLNGGQPQINEDGNGDSANHSNQRCPNGTGGLRNTSTYTQALPSPGFANNCARLSMSKTATPRHIKQNGEITYTLVMTNAGVGNAETLRLTDTLPAQVNFTRWITQSGASVTADVVTWSGLLTAGEALTVSFVVNHAGSLGDLITNTAEITHASLITRTTAQAFVAVDTGLVINEILADVPAGSAGDANGDGTTSDTNDEFVEIVNNSSNPIDISGWRLSDDDSPKHTFLTGSIIPPGCAIVVFGNGTPIGSFGGSMTQTSTNHSLGLTNGPITNDTVSLVNGNFIMADYTYGPEGNANQSITRNPDITGSDPLVQHQAVAGSPFLFSPGTRLDGSSFAGCNAPPRLSLTKAVTPTMNVDLGGLVTYTIVLSNGGTGNAVGTLLTDTLPVSTTFNSWLTQSGATNAGNLITWSGMVTYQQAITFSFIAQHTGGHDDVVTNTAVISHAGTLTDSNVATFTVRPIDPVITISKRVNPLTNATYQGEITYTISLTNGTTTNATGMRLTDTLPISTTFARWLNQPSGASNTATQITWNGLLTASESLEFRFVVSHTGNGYGEVITNLAELEFAGVVTPSNIAVFTITRQPLAVDDSYTTAEGSPLTIAASGVLTNDSDPDGDSLTAAIAVSPTHASSFAFNSSGGFTYFPAGNFAGQDVFTYTVSDGRGGVATATVTINVTPTNDAPLIGRNFVLYDGGKGVIPAVSPPITSGLVYTEPTNTIPQLQAGNNVVVNTTANNNFYAGYVGNPAFYPTPLNHNNGYTLKFSVRVNSETHANNNRAGFSVIAVSADTSKAIELGFWTNRIFAQEGGSGPTLFTQAEHAAFDTTSALVDYELTVLGDSYVLTANGADVLSGTMRNYTAFVGPIDPYETANFIFLGDDTTSARAQFSIGYVSLIVPESLPANPLPDYTTVANTDLSIDSVGAIDFDAAGNNVVLTMTVNNGQLNVSNTGDLAGISGNGSGTLIMTGTLRAINNALGVTQTLRYRSTPGFMGTDTVTVRLNDQGFTGGGGVLTDTATFNINVLAPVLTMTKVVDDAAPIPGQRITYTLVLSNGGNYTATSGLLSDTLPTGLTFAAAQIEPSGAGTVGSPTNLATNLIISPNRLITVTAQFTVGINLPHGTVITNMAALSSTEVLTPAMATALLTVTNQVDLQVSKQVITSSNPVKPGDTVTYTISFSNVGKGLARGILITDIVPSLLTSVSIQTDTTLAMTRTGATTAAWQVADMLNDTSGVITISGVISPLLSTATRFTNTVRLTSTTVQSQTSNDLAAVGLMVQVPALTMSKTMDDDTPSPGQAVTYTIVLSNGGGAPITGATLSDTLPVSLTFVSGSVNLVPSSAGTAGSPSNLATGLTVAANSAVTVTFQVSLTNQAIDGQHITNTASVSATALPAAMTASVVATVSNQADLVISKTVAPSGPVKPGERITYTLSFTNNGPGVAQSIRISDTLPTGLSGLSYQPSGVSVTPTGSISYTWQVADLLANQGGSIQVSGQISTAINSDTRLTNTVEISTSTPDNGGSVYTATVGLDVGVPALTMSKQSAFTGATLLPGQTITYSIIVTNSGSITVTSGTVSDTVPANTTYVGGSIAGGSSRSATLPTLSWTVSNLAPTAVETLTFRVTVANGAVSGTQIINQATLTSSEIMTPLTDTVTDTVILPVADIALSKTRLGSGDVLAGGLITYALRITNSGPNAVNRVLITDTFIGGVSLAAAPTTSSGSCSGSGPIVCQVDNFTGSETITVVLTTNANVSGTVTNTAEITFAAGTFASDNNPGDTRDSVTTTVRFPQTDLQISKVRVGSGDMIAGQPITYTLRITNVGPDVVSQIVVTDTVSGTGASLSSMTPSTGSCGGSSCTFASFTGTATITAVVNTSGSYSGTVTNTAVITFGNGVTATESSPGNESDSVTTAVRFPQTDLQISKVRVGSGDVIAGQPITYTLRITNAGPDVVSQIVVTDTVSGTGASLSSMTPSTGSCTGSSCTFASFTGTATITAVVTTSGSYSGTVTNTAVITFGNGVTATETAPGNESDSVTTAVRFPQTDLQISKVRVGSGDVIAGQPITYTLRITNASGGDTISQVVVTDTVSGTGASLSSLTPSTGSCGGSSCTFASFTGTATITAVVTTSGSYSGTVTNTAVITFGNGVTATETAPGNESDMETTTVRFPQTDLQISKVRVGSGDVLPGQPITYTLRITNVGPDVPSQIVVTDRFTQATAGLISSVNSQRSDGGSCTTGASPLTCQFNNLTNTETITFVFNSSSSVSGLVSNTAEITFAGGVVAADTNLANNGPTTVVTALIAGTDLSVSKSVNDATPFENQQIVYTIRVNNNGPDAATGVVISDALPAGVTHVANNGDGAYNVGTGAWTVPSTVANSSSATLLVTATVNAGTKGTTITNTATLSTVSPQDLNGANNSANAPITVEIPTVSFIAPASINETGGSRIVQVQVNVTDTANITVDYAVSGGTATNGTDYGVTAGTLTFPPGGPLVQTFTVFITDDAIYEGNETINFQLSNVSGNAQIGTANTTLTIIDNEVPPNVAPVGNADVYTTTAGMTLTVAAAGVLVNDTDADGDSLTAILAVNVTHGTLTLSANGSFVYLPNAGFAGTDSFQYRANDGKTNSGLTTVTINVVNKPPTASNDSYTLVQDTVLTVTAAGVLANDSDSDGHPLTATLSSGPANGSLTVSGNGAFTYTPTSGFIGTDSFTYTVSDGYGGVATATVRLIVSLDPPQVGFTQATQTVMETVGATQLVVTLSKVSAVTVTVDYVINPDTAVANDDYLAMNGRLTFPPGTLTQTISLTIVDDLINEASEQFTVRLQNGVNGVVQPTNNPTTVVITDNDPLPTMVFDAPTYRVDEDAGNVTLTVTLSAPSGQPITATVMTTNGTAIAPADYTAVSSTLTFSPGVTQVTVVIPILNDALSEGEERFTVGLTAATGATLGAPSAATVTITDTSRPTVQFAAANYSINEDGGQATIMVTLNQSSSLTVTVAYASADGTATAGNDYTAVSGVLTFPVGSLMQMFTVPITDDALTEPNETVNLQLSNPTHALSGTLMAAVLTIRDNEVVTLTNLVATNDSPTSLGQPTQFTAMVTPASNVTYTWQFGDGSTGSGQNPTHVYPAAGVYTAVVTASNNINLLTATTVVTIQAGDPPITGLLAFNDGPTMLGQPTTLSTTVTAGTNISYTWDYGDGTGGTGPTSNHTYTTVGTYTVIVTASNGVSLMTATTTVVVTEPTALTADLAVSKAVSPAPAIVGETVVYTVQVRNSGPHTATTVLLTDTLPTGLRVVRLPTGCNGRGQIRCTVSDLNRGQTALLTLTVSPTAVGWLTNTVEAVAAEADPNQTNNRFELPLAVGHAKVTLEPSMSSTLVYTKPTNLTATQITVPAGAVTEPLVLLLTELDVVQNLPDGVDAAGLAFTVDLYQNGQVVSGRTLTDPVTMTLRYPADVPPDQLQLLYWNGSQWVDAATTCQPPASYVFDPSQKQVSLSVCDAVGQFVWVQQSKPKPPTLYLPIIINQKPPIGPVYLPIILHGGDSRPSTSTPVTPAPTPVSTLVATPTSSTPTQPDLSVRMSLSPDKRTFSADEAVIISVVVTNQGQQTVTKSFWVDLFINPKTPPTDGRRIWNESCSLTPCYGMAWQVTADLAPGESVTLLSTSDSFSPPHTTWSGKFAAGTTSVYVYVDTWTPGRGPDGAILESNETNNRAEITGLSVTGSRRADEAPTTRPQFPPRWLAEE